MSGLSEDPGVDEELSRITGEEERVLARVQKHVETREMRVANVGMDYDAELIALRDQINEARLEDIPPLIEEMERVAEVAARRAMVTQGVVDPRSPYFGRMVLEEDDRRREVLIGRSTYLHPQTGIRIVDWRDAPVSRLYYRYEEGDEYAEEFGGREVEGEVLTRRTLAINEGELRRIGSPQGTFIRRSDGAWFRAGESARRLTGGQGAAMRAEGHHKPGRLGTGRDGDGREDRFLPEITALIDPRQFELISAQDSGLVVIQGGAGSGKTTIGLHRLAYLNFQDKRRFRPDRMLVMVFNRALERYISRVLPALGVEGVPVTTYERWAARLREQQVPGLPRDYEQDTPSVVTRLKKSPLMLDAIDRHAASMGTKIDAMLVQSLEGIEGSGEVLAVWRRHGRAALGQRLDALARWAQPRTQDDGSVDKERSRPLALRHAIDRVVARGKVLARDVLTAWSELLTDLGALEAVFGNDKAELSRAELRSAHRWCVARCPQIVATLEEKHALASEGEPPKDRSRRSNERRQEREDDEDRGEERSERRASSRHEPGDFHARAQADDRSMGIDGAEEEAPLLLDREDDTLLLRLSQRLWGPLTRGKERVVYEHMFLDEAQDLSPVELAVVVETASSAQSVTLAGDVAQRLLMDNGFTGWDDVLGRLGLDHVEIEPLRITYRSTAQIIEFADDVLGPLRNEQQSTATRQGAPVELFEFGHGGEAVAFLGAALRDLMTAEPRASVAVIARYPEHADLYYKGLVTAEVPYLRRIAQQDFPFKPGIDVTDVRQVKGLEFDYVVLLEVSAAAYPDDHESRHLLHIAATRAAHQLWVTSTGAPSTLLPQKLRDHE